ncbi:oxidoreductase [Microvirga makkahensis]|uniref:SDR family NAD(P)-dependent oxidoreductase n=1 Tax=Microvirga makkahensis TaxID=1128670 RepID=A0A7X3SPF1_9HYPH|nr:oxidoreductase [Microvirga makkahensis]MXQ12396.1 SDR family NAD(P)-dependent oxidoreductase [Microvirga makkahensis]
MATRKWTAADIPPQTERLAVVTGSTSGLGFEAALALAGAGARVVLAARDETKAQQAMASIRQVHASARLEFRQLDTASLTSVREFAARWHNGGHPIDILLLNAGISAVPQREESDDGFERQLATNYLGHFALTGLLLPNVRRDASSRIVPVASIAHRRARLHLDDLQLGRSYKPMDAYGQSKLAMLMFGLELDRRLNAAGSPVRSIPAHPGVASTDITRRGDRAGPIQRFLGQAVFGVIGQSAAQGALPLLFAATSLEAKGGSYYGPDGFREMRGYPTDAEIAPHALDRQAAERLWSASEELTNVTYQF